MAFIKHKDSCKVWIFAPYLVTDDPIISSYYDYTQSIGEFTRVFDELNCEWEWVNITLSNYRDEIERVKRNGSGNTGNQSDDGRFTMGSWPKHPG